MPIADLDSPVVGKNVVIEMLVQLHILMATFVLGASLIAPTAEYLGVATFFFGFFTILINVGGSVFFTSWISKDE